MRKRFLETHTDASAPLLSPSFQVKALQGLFIDIVTEKNQKKGKLLTKKKGV
jgi:hypothetical protein